MVCALLVNLSKYVIVLTTIRFNSGFLDLLVWVGL